MTMQRYEIKRLEWTDGRIDYWPIHNAFTGFVNFIIYDKNGRFELRAGRPTSGKSYFEFFDTLQDAKSLAQKWWEEDLIPFLAAADIPEPPPWLQEPDGHGWWWLIEGDDGDPEAYYVWSLGGNWHFGGNAFATLAGLGLWQRVVGPSEIPKPV